MTDPIYEKKWGKGPHVSVDVVLFLDQKVLLILRKDGQWALPGGFVEPDETIAQAAYRELKEETGVYQGFIHVTPRFYDRVDRDPRSRVISFAFFDEYYTDDEIDWVVGTQILPGSDAVDAKWTPIYEAHKLSLYADHNQILVDAVVARKPRNETV